MYKQKKILHRSTSNPRHIHTTSLVRRIFTPPQTGHRLCLSVKCKARLPVKCVRPSAGNAFLISREGEAGQRNRNRYVDSHLANLDLALKAAGGRAGGREDGSAIAVFIRVDQADGIVDGGNIEANE